MYVYNKYKSIQIGAMTSLPEPTLAVITNMGLIQSMLRRPGDQKTTNFTSINALSTILKHRNSTYAYSDEHRHRDQSWIVNRNVQLGVMMDSIRQLKKKIDESQIHNKQYENNKQNGKVFCVNGEEVAERGMFLVKAASYLQYQSVCKLNHGQNNYRFKNTMKILKKIKIKTPSNAQIKLSNQAKLQCYLKAVRQILSSGIHMKGKDYTASFKAETKEKLWDILDVFSKCPQGQLYQMALKSLSLVQSQFSSSLPSNHESIIFYLNSHYLRNLPDQYKMHETLGPIWGICFVLYKAGRKNQFYRYIADGNLRDAFSRVDTAIAKGDPQSITGFENNQDIFHDQLIYTLSGQPKFTSQILINPNTLDVVWIFLRNVAIFKKSLQKFKQLTQSLYISYQNGTFSHVKIKNLLYLLCFEQLAEIGANQFMDQYDFVHFLIVLYHVPVFRNLCNTWQNKLQRRLTERLLQLIHKLLQANKNQCYFYMSLLPLHTLASEVSSMITKNNLQQQIKWKQIKKYIPQITYEELVRLTCEKYSSINNDALFAAEKFQELLGHKLQSVQLVIDMLVKTFKNVPVSQDNLSRGRRIITKILKKQQQIGRYRPLLQFFIEYIGLIQIVESGSQHKIYQYLKKCHNILVSQTIPATTAQAIWQLHERQSFICYINYMKQIVLAYEICLTKMGRLLDLQQVQRLTLIAIKGLMKEEAFSQLAEMEGMLELVRVLEEALYRCSYT